MVHLIVDELPWILQITTYLPYLTLLAFSYVQQFLVDFVEEIMYLLKKKKRPDVAPLIKKKSAFYDKWLYARVRDLFNRPINSLPAGRIDVLEREGNPLLGKLRYNNKTTNCLNLSSYNYLGFADNANSCAIEVQDTIKTYGLGASCSRIEAGTTKLHQDVEGLISEFIGKDDCILFGMGYATNSTTIPALCGKGDLIISDSFNHASIIVGCKGSGARIKVFKHNDPEHLEKVVRQAIIDGQPRTHLPWRKIIILVEGIYSMEGEICKLPGIVEVKKKYSCYLYVDEAHSIGALGKTGRGVCEYNNVSTDDIDILMGTLTKSFAAVGGYIASDQRTIDFLRTRAFSSVDDFPMSPGCCRQILSSLSIIMGNDNTDIGKNKINQLQENVTYFRNALVEAGFIIIGDADSPVIPLMIINPCKMCLFSRLCLDANLAVVVASYPATPLLLSRARFCVSASHTLKDLEDAVEKIIEIGDICGLRYNKSGNYIKLHE
eukprot:TRINITY_DN1312_c5_g1_i1.p1 TRINITY_DN1312_c5_g1~~TRINITY_DN1312_c5_g1_i1.p1  ORF type:complete len:492 (+),score=163.73 TRINITY_DN1312_c5_g1_i1:48-1523(+)